MQKVYATEPLERVWYRARKGKKSEVYLRENIHKVEIETPEGETCTQYAADEVFLLTSLTKEQVEEQFDELWVQAETANKSDKERIAELEDLVGALIDTVLEV